MFGPPTAKSRVKSKEGDNDTSVDPEYRNAFPGAVFAGISPHRQHASQLASHQPRSQLSRRTDDTLREFSKRLGAPAYHHRGSGNDGNGTSGIAPACGAANGERTPSE